MAIYFVFHRLKKSGEEVSDILNKKSPDIAKTTAHETPCTCLKTWSPLAYGREDYLFCLWEANKQQDVEATIESLGLMDYFTLDCMRVDEIDWAALAKSEL